MVQTHTSEGHVVGTDIPVITRTYTCSDVHCAYMRVTYELVDTHFYEVMSHEFDAYLSQVASGVATAKQQADDANEKMDAILKILERK